MYAVLPDLESLDRLQLIEIINRLYPQAYTDRLTGLGNRSAFEEKRLKPEGIKYVFYCDLDGLKQINDSQGHDMGDAYIRRAASSLEKVFRRKSDVISRIGGDEFVVFSSYNPKDLATLAMFSIGVAETEGVSIDEAISLAEQRMYEQKRSRKCKQ